MSSHVDIRVVSRDVVVVSRDVVVVW